MNTSTHYTALIAEDEPLLARALQQELALAWPALEVLAIAKDGESAVAQALALKPDVLFFDIRMPGQSGLEAAAALADAWPQEQAFPALVFVTAYDQYAVQAFDAQAVDYLLKPLQKERLQKTVTKLQSALGDRLRSAMNLETSLTQLRQLLGAELAPPRSAASAPLHLLQVSIGQTIQMVPVSEVICFEAADKYVRVLTPGHEYLIRTPLKELLPQLAAAEFWQVHRGTVVRASAIETVTRDEAGKLWLKLRGCPEKLAVSRLYAHQFKAM